MGEDVRRQRKGNRRKVAREVKASQRAAEAAHGGTAGPKGKGGKPRASRALRGADVWMRKIRNAFGAKAAREVFDMVGEPGRDVLVLVNKVLTTYSFALLAAQSKLEKAFGTEAEDSVRAYVEDVRLNARVVKDIAMGLVRTRQQYVEEDLDSRPDAIELTGAEVLRSQLTTLTTWDVLEH